MGQVKIALVHDFLSTYGGAERVLSQLHKLYPAAPIHTAFADPELVSRHFSDATIVVSDLQRSPLMKWPRLLVTAIPLALESFDFSEYDTVISSSGAFSYGIITSPSTRHISYCHSPMRYAWDWHAEYLVEQGVPSALLPAARFFTGKLRDWDKVSSRRVDTWLANSGAVAERIKKYYRYDSTVIYPPVDTEFFSNTDTQVTRGSHALVVSRLSPNKRIDLVIEACAQAGVELRIAGKGASETSLRAIAAKAGGNVTFLGPISEAEKRRQLAEAGCFIFASEDDFGIAPVEALAMSTPVIAFKRGGALETVTDGVNGRFFDEPTVESLTSTLKLFKTEGVSADEAAIRNSSLRFSSQAFLSAITNVVDNG